MLARYFLCKDIDGEGWAGAKVKKKTGLTSPSIKYFYSVYQDRRESFWIAVGRRRSAGGENEVVCVSCVSRSVGACAPMVVVGRISGHTVSQRLHSWHSSADCAAPGGGRPELHFIRAPLFSLSLFTSLLSLSGQCFQDKG